MASSNALAKKKPEPAAGKACFVICRIGADGSPERRRTDDVLEFIIRPAATECGYAVERADQLDNPGLITNQIVERLLDADLVVADLTDSSANVYYELAIRHAVARPLVQLIDSAQELPFDLKMTRTIPFDWRDLRSADACRKAIARQIRAVEANPREVDNPLTAAIDLSRLRTSGNPEQQTLADLIQQVGALERAVRGLASVQRVLTGSQLSGMLQGELSRAGPVWGPAAPADSQGQSVAPRIAAAVAQDAEAPHPLEKADASS